MGIAVLLVIALGLLMGLIMLPTVFDFCALFSLVPETPLYAIIQILPYAFLGLVIIGIFWTLTKQT